MRHSPLLASLILFVSLIGALTPRVVATQADAEQVPEMLADLAEFSITIDDDGLDVPEAMLVGYAELDVRQRPQSNLDAEADRLTTGQARGIYALHLIRVSPSGDVPEFFDAPAADQTIIGSESSVLEATEVLTEILITLEVDGGDDTELDLVGAPESLTFDQLEAEIASGGPAFDWSDDAFRPGLPVVQADGEPAVAVVTIPFTFPHRATYVLYAPDAPEYLAVYQAVAVYFAPGCAPDFAPSTSTGECEPISGTAGDGDTGGPPSCEIADVTAHISRNSIDLGCVPLELGREVWAIINATGESRTFSIYQVPQGTTVDQLRDEIESGGAEHGALADQGMVRLCGLTEFSGAEMRRIMVTLGPGFYAAVSTADGIPDVAVGLFELSD